MGEFDEGKQEAPRLASDEVVDVDDLDEGSDDIVEEVATDPTPSHSALATFDSGDSSAPGVSDPGPDTMKDIKFSPTANPTPNVTAGSPPVVTDAGPGLNTGDDSLEKVHAPLDQAEGTAKAGNLGMPPAAAQTVNTVDIDVKADGASPKTALLPLTTGDFSHGRTDSDEKVEEGVVGGEKVGSGKAEGGEADDGTDDGGKAEDGKPESGKDVNVKGKSFSSGSKVDKHASTMAPAPGVDGKKAPALFGAVKTPQFGAPASFSGGAFQSTPSPFLGFSASFGKKQGEGTAKIPLFGPALLGTQPKPATVTGSFGFPTLATFGSGTPGNKPVTFSTPQSFSKSPLNANAPVFTPLGKPPTSKANAQKSTDHDLEGSASSAAFSPSASKTSPKTFDHDAADAEEKEKPSIAQIVEKESSATIADVASSLKNSYETAALGVLREQPSVTNVEMFSKKAVNSDAAGGPSPSSDPSPVAPSDEDGHSIVKNGSFDLKKQPGGEKVPKEGSNLASAPVREYFKAGGIATAVQTPAVTVKLSTVGGTPEVPSTTAKPSSTSLEVAKPATGIVALGEREILGLSGCDLFFITLNPATNRKMMKKRAAGENLRVVAGGQSGTGLELIEGGELWQFLKSGKECLTFVRARKENTLICTRIGNEKPKNDSPVTPEKIAVTVRDEESLKSLFAALLQAEAAAASVSARKSLPGSVAPSQSLSKGSSSASGKLSRDEDLKKKKLAALQSLRKKVRPKKATKSASPAISAELAASSAAASLTLKSSTPRAAGAAAGKRASSPVQKNEKQGLGPTGGESKEASKVTKRTVVAGKLHVTVPTDPVQAADTLAISPRDRAPATPGKAIPGNSDPVAIDSERAETADEIKPPSLQPPSLAVGLSSDTTSNPSGIVVEAKGGTMPPAFTKVKALSKSASRSDSKPMDIVDDSQKAAELMREIPGASKTDADAAISRNAEKGEDGGISGSGASTKNKTERTILVPGSVIKTEDDGAARPGIGNKRSAPSANPAQAAATKKVKFALDDENVKPDAAGMVSPSLRTAGSSQSGPLDLKLHPDGDLTPVASKIAPKESVSNLSVTPSSTAPTPVATWLPSDSKHGNFLVQGHDDLKLRRNVAETPRDSVSAGAFATAVPNTPCVPTKSSASDEKISNVNSSTTAASTAALEAARRGWESEKQDLLAQVSRVPTMSAQVQQLTQECAGAKALAGSLDARASAADSALQESIASREAETAKYVALSQSVQAAIEESRSLKKRYKCWLDSGAANARMECRPESGEDFCERLDTFRPSSWSGFSEVGVICPVECAMHGWFNSGMNKITSTDGASVYFDADLLTRSGISSYRVEVARVRDAIVASGHSMLSAWIGASCPDSFRKFGARRLTAAAMSSNADVLRRCGVLGILSSAAVEAHARSLGPHAGDDGGGDARDEASALASGYWAISSLPATSRGVLECHWCKARHSLPAESDEPLSRALADGVDRSAVNAAAVQHYPFCAVAQGSRGVAPAAMTTTVSDAAAAGSSG